MTAESFVNTVIQAAGNSASKIPRTPAMPLAQAPPIQAIRSARAVLPAPMLMPTNEVIAAPKPKTSGMIKNSTREPMPYPASAASPKVPTSAVRMRTVETVSRGDSDAGKATFKMSSKFAFEKTSADNRSLTKLDGLRSCRSRAPLTRAPETIADTAAPVIPSLGRPKAPRIKQPDNGIWISAPKIIAPAGNCMLPMPRKMAVVMPKLQIKIPPERSR